MSEYHLTNCDLQSDTDGLWVDGVGWIAQYHCYCDMLYSHGVIYWLRDLLLSEIASKMHSDVDLTAQITRLNVLNSKISAYETGCQSQHTPLRPTQCRP